MIGFIIGTRPEQIKLAPVIREFEEHEVRVVYTGQHDLTGVHIPYGVSLPTMVGELHDRLKSYKLVVVQGDTDSALAGALAAFHLGIPIAHVEAGLRTYDLRCPFPEEGNRRMISQLAALHFCPTEKNISNLIMERIRSKGHVIGNPGMDSLREIVEQQPPKKSEFCETKRILVTMHRRESWGCIAARAQDLWNMEVPVTWVKHPNPKADHKLPDSLMFKSIGPQSHEQMVRLIQDSRIVLTDSGGMVEECSYLGKPCLVLREKTERPEAEYPLHIPAFPLVRGIIERASKQPVKPCPFGDGHSAPRIAKIIREFLGMMKSIELAVASPEVMGGA